MMTELIFKRTPVIFTSRESVMDTLVDTIPFVAEENTFKLCNFCGPYTTHADGCKDAIKMFEAAYPEYEHMKKLEEYCQKSMLMAAFQNSVKNSVVILVSTTYPKRTAWFQKVYEKWRELRERH